MRQRPVHRDLQRALLADRLPPLVHDREPVGVGIVGESDRGAEGADTRPQRAQVLGQGFRHAREAPVRLAVEALHLAAQRLEELGRRP